MGGLWAIGGGGSFHLGGSRSYTQSRWFGFFDDTPSRTKSPDERASDSAFLLAYSRYTIP